MKKRTRIAEGKSLKGLLKQAGLTQRQLADELGVAVSTVGFWIAGEYTPSFENACRMSVALKVPLNELAEVLGLPYYEPPETFSLASVLFSRLALAFLKDLF